MPSTLIGFRQDIDYPSAAKVNRVIGMDVQRNIGVLLIMLADLERGQEEALITAIILKPAGAHLTFVGGELMNVSYGVTAPSLHSAIENAIGDVRPAVAEPASFPPEPLTLHQKWTELLGDLGGWISIMTGINPQLGLLSIRRQGAAAVVRVGDGTNTMDTTIRLDDGRLLVGVTDDLVTEFAERPRR